jgi:hypothetical protein
MNKMKKIITLLIAALLFVGITYGNESMVSQVKKTVTFIYLPSSGIEPTPNGTGFFVGIPSEQDPNITYVYLVTAKHVLQKNNVSFHDTILVRINKKNGDSDLIPLMLTGTNSVPVFTHSDKDVDIAVIPFAPSSDKYDIKWIPDSMIVTKDKFDSLHIREGDDIFFGGLFTPFTGAKKNIPILRFGKVAMVSDEKIPWGNEMLDLYLMETQSFGGNSGSPVFFNLNPSRNPGEIVLGAPQLYLAGVMKGSFLNASKIQVVNNSPTPISTENAGIAAVVPSYQLQEILFSPKPKQMRK